MSASSLPAESPIDRLINSFLIIWTWSSLVASTALLILALGFGTLPHPYIISCELFFSGMGGWFVRRRYIRTGKTMPMLWMLITAVVVFAITLSLMLPQGFYLVPFLFLLCIAFALSINATSLITPIIAGGIFLFASMATLDTLRLGKSMQLADSVALHTLIVVLIIVVVMIITINLYQWNQGLRQSLTLAHRRQKEAESLQVAQQETLKQLQYQTESQARLLELVRILEIPTIPIADGVLALPIVGHLDTGRINAITESLLKAVHANRTRAVVLDVTGIAAIDTATARHLLTMIHSVKLLGAYCIVSGIRASVASTMAQLGINMQDIHTVGSLGDALKRITTQNN